MFIVLCMPPLIGIGLIPIIVGFFSAILCGKIARSAKSLGFRLGLCFGVTIGAWVFVSVVAIVLRQLLYRVTGNF
ncbi:MAG TPA: hypothetical protein PLZ08_11275 [Bacillota bacterium]|nr:hypothetical protein [Bacillota bacterium]HOL10723.1 hypothetical protein [Bacillota bacterium]HPO98519.1 hypothetical protein [Bacillota bacterium]